MKTIFVTFPFGIAARNVICSRLVEEICEKGFCVVIIAPQKSFELLRTIYSDETRVILEPYPKYDSFFKGGVNRDASLLEQMMMGLINASLDTGATRYRRKELWLQGRYCRFVIRWFFQKIFAGKYKWSEYFRKLDAKFFPDTWFKEIFDKYNPAAVFSPHVQFDFNLIKRARMEGVPSFGQILSIDNLSTKGNMRAKSDHLFVWNDLMKEEAVKYNTYDPEKVMSVGIPQYDIYHNKSILMPREEFYASIGADPQKALFVYASEAGISPDDKELVEFLLESQKLNKFIKPFNIVTRIHPRDPINPFEKFSNNPDVIIDDPRTNQCLFIDRWYPSMENIKFLVNLMYHSSLVLTIGGTVGLDAVGFGKPVVCFEFDFAPKPYYQSIRKYYDNFPHLRFWLDIGAFGTAKNREELIAEINNCLKSPDYKKRERAILIDRLFYKFDGRVGNRMAAAIMSNI